MFYKGAYKKLGRLVPSPPVYATLSVKQFGAQCRPKENVVMETGGKEAFVLRRR